MTPKAPSIPNPDKAPAVDSRSEVDQFLNTVRDREPVHQSTGTPGRLIFAMDATASRQASWDQAMTLQTDMFLKTRSIGSLDVQLAYYRGYKECRASRWVQDANTLITFMGKVRCLAGRTQIARILEHGLAETRQKSVQALVFVGDAAEENIDILGDIAGRMKLMGLPVFVFQEGSDVHARHAFASIASLSGGAHCQFNERSATELGELLNAVAAYAAGGKRALTALSSDSTGASRLLEQLDR